MRYEAVTGRFALAHSQASIEAEHRVIDAYENKFYRARKYATWCGMAVIVLALFSIFIF